MSKEKILFFGFVALLFSISCNARKQSLNNISELQTNLDSVLSNNPILTPEQKLHADELIAAYSEFVEKFPEDSLSAKFLFETSRLKLMIPDYPAALEVLASIPEKYPADEQAPIALSTAASLCENVLQDCNKAEEYLKQLKEKYPDHPTAVNIDLQIEYVCDPQGYLEAVRGSIMEKDSVASELINTPK